MAVISQKIYKSNKINLIILGTELKCQMMYKDIIEIREYLPYCEILISLLPLNQYK